MELGYNEKGQGILFVGEWKEDGTENVLNFSDRGLIIEDALLAKLVWAPILPVKAQPAPVKAKPADVKPSANLPVAPAVANHL